MQATTNPQPLYFLIAAAARSATNIGLHRRSPSLGFNPIEVQRCRVFWMLYSIDKRVALRTGRLPCINDDECDVELPDEDPLDGLGTLPLDNGKARFNFFLAKARFAVIESKVLMQLYSAKATKQSDGELLNTIGHLDGELEEWKDSLPAKLRPGDEQSAAPQIKTTPMVALHFAYFNCLTAIHRRSIHHGYWTSRLSDSALTGPNARPVNPRIFDSAALCVSAARSSIKMIERLDPSHYPLLRYVAPPCMVLAWLLLCSCRSCVCRGRKRTLLMLCGQVCDVLSGIGADNAVRQHPAESPGPAGADRPAADGDCGRVPAGRAGTGPGGRV